MPRVTSGKGAQNGAAGTEPGATPSREAVRRLARHAAWQLAVTIAFGVLALRAIDVDGLFEAAREVAWGWVPLALLTFTAAKYIDAWRWRYLLRGVAAPPQRALFGAFLIGNMVNNALPLRLGDIAKIQVLANRYGASRAGLAASVFVVEASLDGVVFVVFLVTAILVFGLTDVAAAGVAVVTVLAALGLVAALLLTRIGSGQRFAGLVPEAWRSRMAEQLRGVSEGLYALRSWRRAVAAVALSVPAWLVEAYMFALFGRAFDLGLSYPTYVAAMVAANLAVSVPVALWNFGPYEALVAAVLTSAGVPESVALSYALVTHVVTNLWIQATGLVSFSALRIRPAELLRRPNQ